MKTLSRSNNSSTISGFILLGFPCPREGQILLFVLFFVVYSHAHPLKLQRSGSSLPTLPSISTTSVTTSALASPVPKAIIIISQMSFCGSRIIDHFLCDPGPLLALSCSRAPLMEFFWTIIMSLLLFTPFLFIIGSYMLVLRAVFRVPSRDGRRKALSTCGPHVTVVSLFYGSVMIMYLSPTSEHEAGMQKLVTLLYSVVTPLINPVIYSLRNKDMKHAMRKLLKT
ncbi:olfactory receptor 11G2-like [Microtus ochrogaster]|uniref:Olfactory receptor 11G2-like n=1 Tax=Microtus ochrogaster TaxID=79684 RepID=A0ABM1AY96_MICOH|nr:olfactory receptor 11G2-like [Microtus ochrogaster]